MKTKGVRACLGILSLLIFGIQAGGCNLDDDIYGKGDKGNESGEMGMTGTMEPSTAEPSMLTECRKSREFRKLIDHVEQFANIILDQSLSGTLTDAGYNLAFKDFQKLELDRIGAAGLSAELQAYCGYNPCTLGLAVGYAAEYINTYNERWFKKTDSVCQPGFRIVKNPDGTIGSVEDPCLTRKDVFTFLPGYSEAKSLAEDIKEFGHGLTRPKAAALNSTAEDKLVLKQTWHDLAERIRNNGIAIYSDLNCSMDEAFAGLLGRGARTRQARVASDAVLKESRRDRRGTSSSVVPRRSSDAQSYLVH